jgi:hypothetical protein
LTCCSGCTPSASTVSARSRISALKRCLRPDCCAFGRHGSGLGALLRRLGDHRMAGTAYSECPGRRHRQHRGRRCHYQRRLALTNP